MTHTILSPSIKPSGIRRWNREPLEVHVPAVEVRRTRGSADVGGGSDHTFLRYGRCSRHRGWRIAPQANPSARPRVKRAATKRQRISRPGEGCHGGQPAPEQLEFTSNNPSDASTEMAASR